jgi:ABC-type uncharacterized transport system YnjBCD ATPase subunit
MTLSDTQFSILSAASQRPDHAAMLPANLKGSAAKKVIDRLLKQKLLQEFRAIINGGDNAHQRLRRATHSRPSLNASVRFIFKKRSTKAPLSQ